jgi:flagellar hook-length control protein FliK
MPLDPTTPATTDDGGDGPTDGEPVTAASDERTPKTGHHRAAGNAASATDAPVPAGMASATSAPANPSSSAQPGAAASSGPATANASATAPAAGEVPVEAQGAQAWRQVTNNAQLNRAVENGVTVRVDHADLGPVEVRAQVEAGAIDVELHAQRSTARDALHESLPALRAELEATGVNTRVLTAHRSELGGSLGHGTAQNPSDQEPGARDGRPSTTADAGTPDGRNQRQGRTTANDGQDMGRSVPSAAALTNEPSDADATARGRLRTEPTTGDLTSAARLDRRIDLQL